MEPLVSTLESSALSLTKPFTFLQKDNPYFKTLARAGEEMVYKPLDKFDPPPVEKAELKATKRHIRQKFLCDNLDNKLPHCDQNRTLFQEAEPELQQIPVGGTRNSLGFWSKHPKSLRTTVLRIIACHELSLDHVYAYGMELSCLAQGTCIAGTGSLDPANFDGVYQFYGINPLNQSPVYRKVDPWPSFASFQSTRDLFLWQPASHNLPVQSTSRGQYWATITPSAPTFEVSLNLSHSKDNNQK
eukprot:Gregarina_sp_Poly_1__1134@NODE_1278_length_4511_cov_81_929118_g5_i1_p2_GENE_NODE_1278_length_4511_cov_81_929118_g5_i1NODE_1278_length_4511_cov_81_929118_g5_i1_p2_ORF_typecomplete_len244_score23_60_NODE_1278_length_4511_cov_81_929118_g5_i121252856